ncbi:MAG: GNAT family N-acetyltransferase [Acidimicrobiia bacterium]
MGTSLVAAASESATTEGYREMVVKTEVDNVSARAFYETRGFSGSRVETELVEGSPVEVCVLARSI